MGLTVTSIAIAALLCASDATGFINFTIDEAAALRLVAARKELPIGAA
jgi:hypothetical protein